MELPSFIYYRLKQTAGHWLGQAGKSWSSLLSSPSQVPFLPFLVLVLLLPPVGLLGYANASFPTTPYSPIEFPPRVAGFSK